MPATVPIELLRAFPFATAVWGLARLQDKAGAGKAELSLEYMCAVFNRADVSILRWLREAKKVGLLRYCKRTGDRIFVYYAAPGPVAIKHNLGKLTAFAEVSEEELKTPKKLLVQMAAQYGQKQSRYAAWKDLSDRGQPQDLGLDNYLQAKKPGMLRIYGKKQAFDKLARATASPYRKQRDVLVVSDRTITYGMSQAKIANICGKSDRTIRNYLANTEKTQVLKVDPLGWIKEKVDSPDYLYGKVDRLRTNKYPKKSFIQRLPNLYQENLTFRNCHAARRRSKTPEICRQEKLERQRRQVSTYRLK